MLADFITQCGKANQAVLNNFFNNISQTAPPTGGSTLAPMLSTGDSWKAMARNYMDQAAALSTNRDAALNTAWREQRDKLDLDGSAAALQSLTDIHVNLISRLVTCYVQNIQAASGVSAQYFRNLALARDGTDIMMALGQCVSDLEAAAKSGAMDGAGIIGGIQPALTQWMQTNVSEKPTEQAASIDTEVDNNGDEPTAKTGIDKRPGNTRTKEK